MITASKLAGFFAAHAIWCVSDGEILIPILAYTTEPGEPGRMERLVINDDLEASVSHGKRRLESNDMDAIDAALLYDARIVVGGEKVDAIIVEMRAYFSPQSEAVLAVPYTPKSAGGFRVHKPKLLTWEGCEDFDMSQAFESFFEGVGEHEQGSKVWDECLDESK